MSVQRSGLLHSCIWLLGVCGCAGTETEPAPTALPPGWITTTLETPDKVLALFEPDNTGWAAFHRGDLGAALQSSEPMLTARAEQELRETRTHLLALQHATAPELVRTWAGRASLPTDTALHTWAALVVVDADEDPTPLLRLAPPPADPGWANVHAALGSDLPDEARFAVVADRAAGPVGDCLRAHQAVRRSGRPDLSPVDETCAEPFLAEADGTRALTDPLRLRTWLLVHPAPDPPAHPLASTIFSAMWGPSDHPSPATGPTATLLGLRAADSTDGALQRVQECTRALDSWQSVESWPGSTLAADLDVFEIYRTRLVATWAAQATDPAITAEALRAVRDTNAGRTLGPTRPPSILALEASVSVQTGHIRSALPALQALAPLAEVIPELPGLTELVNDLQIASTLGRSGDSKEP